MAVGATVYGGVLLRGVVSAVGGGTVALEAELKPAGTAFDGTATVIGDPVSSGSSAELSVEGLDPGSYHWRARALPDEGAAGAWIHYGANPEPSGVDFAVSDGSPPPPNAAPAMPAGVEARTEPGGVLLDSGKGVAGIDTVILPKM